MGETSEVASVPRGAAKTSALVDASGWDRVFDRAGLAVIGVVALLILLTWRDYGITWDESWHIHYGRLVLRWYGLADSGALTYRADYLYGGGFDTLAAAAAEISPGDTYVAVHLFGATVGLLGLVGARALARQLGGAAAGLCATLMLALTSVYYGHMFNNPKDLPFAVGYVWALYGISRLIMSLPAPRRRDWVVLAITLGAALSVRIAGLLTVIYLGLATLAWLGLWAWQRGRVRAALEQAEVLAPRLLASCLGGWAIMLAFWPWAQLDPIRRPYLALRVMTHFNQHVRTMPFAGETIWTYDVRWDYLPRYFALKLPESLLVFGLLGVVGLAVAVARLRRDDPADASRTLCLGILALAILFPPAYAVYKGSILYDGLRHFLFLVPPIAVVAGLTLSASLRGLAGRGRTGLIGAWVLGILVGAAWIDQARVMVQLHPHQYVHFNHLAGGLPGAYLRYDTDYYGNSYREAYAELREHLWRTEGEDYLNTDYILSGCIPARVAENYTGGNFQWRAERGDPYDFYAGYTRGNCHERLASAPELFRVERQGTLLNVVRDTRKPPGPEGSVRSKRRADQARADSRESKRKSGGKGPRKGKRKGKGRK